MNIFRVRVFTSSGSTGGGGGNGDAKIIISPNTSFGDIITMTDRDLWSTTDTDLWPMADRDFNTVHD